MKQTTVPIKGMHCKSCEIMIEEELKEIPGVTNVEVSHRTRKATIHHDSPLKQSEIVKAVKKAGYELGTEDPKPFFSKNVEEYKELLVTVTIVALVLLIASQMGLSAQSLGSTLAPTSIPLIFLIGLTAGLSTCMALVGGLVLSVSALHAKLNPQASVSEKFRPHLAFNAGRIVSYLVLGGLVGMLGSLFRFSSSLLGILTLSIGLIMIVFGLQLTGLFPRLTELSLTLPSRIGKTLGLGSSQSGQYSDGGAAFAGATTFFLPCGFTQSMQLFAMSTGSFTQGALVMGVFALGTMPGLLGVGGLSAVLKGTGARMFYKFASVIVIFFALTNISRGLTLSGWQTSIMFNNGVIDQSNKQVLLKQQSMVGNNINPSNTGSEQVISAVFNGDLDLKPNKFSVQANQPVRFVVDAKVDGTGCMSAMMIPGLVNKPSLLEAGKKLEFAFTPTKKGVYKIACAMGVPWGDITVN